MALEVGDRRATDRLVAIADVRDAAAEAADAKDEVDDAGDDPRFRAGDPGIPRLVVEGKAVGGALEFVGRVVEDRLVDVEHDAPGAAGAGVPLADGGGNGGQGLAVDLPGQDRVLLGVTDVLDLLVGGGLGGHADCRQPTADSEHNADGQQPTADIVRRTEFGIHRTQLKEDAGM